MSDGNKRKGLSSFMEKFIISILGTTISIALTFGTTALINNHKKTIAKRQTAMLVIHDINNTIKLLENSKLQHEKSYESTKYFMEYMDRPEAADSVKLAQAIDDVLRMLTRIDRDKSINESTEKIFTGGLDVWNNLDNMRFIENVQSFYYARRDWLDYTNTSVNWIAPLSETEIAAQIANYDYSQSFTNWDVWGDFLRNKLKDKTIRYYLDITPNRIGEYNRMIQTLSDLNEENMFLMNITDEELESFINKIEDNKSPLNGRDVVGTWVDSQNVSNSHLHEEEFRSDCTFEVRDSIVYTAWHFRGNIKVNVSVEGKWEVKKDSLIRYYDKETLRSAIDTTGVSAGAAGREGLSRFIQTLSEYYEEQLYKEFDTLSRVAYKGSFNLTHSKMELTSTVKGEDGEPYELTKHFKRK